MKKILVYEASSSQALAIVKYIKQYSIYYIVGCLQKRVKFYRSNYDEIVIVNNFAEIIVDDYDFILPMGANSTFDVVTKNTKLSYLNNIFFDINNLIVFDKSKMLNIVNSINIPIPETYDSKKQIKNFPIFYKENFENGGGIRGIANSIEEIPENKRLLYQEFIDTPSTYGVGFLSKNGKVLTYTMHKEVLSIPKEGGSAVLIESFEDKRLLQYTETIVKKLNYNGWGLAEFKYCKRRDDYVFMEVNAKFWASIEFTLRNNSQFLKKLFSIEYTQKPTDRILFVNRLFQYSFIDIIANSKYFYTSYAIRENSFIYQIVRRFVPQQIVDIVKRVMKG